MRLVKRLQLCDASSPFLAAQTLHLDGYSEIREHAGIYLFIFR